MIAREHCECCCCGCDQYLHIALFQLHVHRLSDPHDNCICTAGEAALLAVLEHRSLLDAAVREQLAQVCAIHRSRLSCSVPSC